MKNFVLAVLVIALAIYFLPWLVAAMVGVLVAVTGTLIAAMIVGGLVFFLGLLVFGSVVAAVATGLGAAAIVAFSWLWPLLLLVGFVWALVYLFGHRRPVAY